MSMYRQLWLAIIISMLLALGGSLLASMLSARSYLQSQLSIKNADNASALALSLSQSKPDAVSVEVVVSALFDSGHYELIRVVDPQGKTIVERSTPHGSVDAPAWFVRNLPIQADPGQAQVSDGWRQFGTITLISHSRFAYGALWNSVVFMSVALALAGLLGCYLGSLILRRLKAPLNAVIAQAKAITQRRFVSIDEPRVPELRQLALAMNATVGRLKAMFDEEAARLEAVRRDANFDTLTGLANRDYFMARLRESVLAEDSTGGVLFIARLAHLADANQSLGRAATDELLRAFAGALSANIFPHSEETLLARLSGADFALLAVRSSASQDAAEHLLQSLTQAASAYLPARTTTWLGGAHFPRGVKPEALLARVDLALACAESAGSDGFRLIDLHPEVDAPKSAAEWSTIIGRALERRWVRLVNFPVSDFAGRLIHRECPLRLKFDADGQWQPAGLFLPMAERLHLTPQLDLCAVALGLDELDAQPQLLGLAINLSASSLQVPEFRRKLSALLKRRSASSRLWLEVSEVGALAHFESFKALCRELVDSPCQLGIEHFGRQFSQIGRLHDLGLDYLKVDGSFIHGLESNAGNQAFLKGLSTIAHGIGLGVIGEGVNSAAEFRALGKIGFDGATGPAVTDPLEAQQAN